MIRRRLDNILRTLLISTAAMASLASLTGCDHARSGRGATGPTAVPASPEESPSVGEYAVVSHAAHYFAAANDNAISFRAESGVAKRDASEEAAAGIVLRVLSSR